MNMDGITARNAARRRNDVLDAGGPLREPKGIFQLTIRKLAEAAMAVTHHDIGDDEPSYVHEVRTLEAKFTNILRGKMKP